jgi:hypothetical protein
MEVCILWDIRTKWYGILCGNTNFLENHLRQIRIRQIYLKTMRCLHHQGVRPDDGGSKHLWNVGKLLPDYTARNNLKDSYLYTRRRKNLKSHKWQGDHE